MSKPRASALSATDAVLGVRWDRLLLILFALSVWIGVGLVALYLI